MTNREADWPHSASLPAGWSAFLASATTLALTHRVLGTHYLTTLSPPRPEDAREYLRTHGLEQATARLPGQVTDTDRVAWKSLDAFCSGGFLSTRQAHLVIDLLVETRTVSPDFARWMAGRLSDPTYLSDLPDSDADRRDIQDSRPSRGPADPHPDADPSDVAPNDQ